MSAPIVAVSGSLRAGSSTTTLVRGILREADAAPDAPIIELSALAHDLATAVTGGERSPELDAALAAVGGAEMLVVATPIYRGSYTGLFKQFFDVVHQDALDGTAVLLAAGGGSDEHALAIDHELRPLFAFFRARTLPVGVYARPTDYADGEIASDALRARIRAAVASR